MLVLDGKLGVDIENPADGFDASVMVLDYDSLQKVAQKAMQAAPYHDVAMVSAGATEVPKCPQSVLS